MQIGILKSPRFQKWVVFLVKMVHWKTTFPRYAQVFLRNLIAIATLIRGSRIFSWNSQWDKRQTMHLSKGLYLVRESWSTFRLTYFCLFHPHIITLALRKQIHRVSVQSTMHTVLIAEYANWFSAELSVDQVEDLGLKKDVVILSRVHIPWSFICRKNVPFMGKLLVFKQIAFATGKLVTGSEPGTFRTEVQPSAFSRIFDSLTGLSLYCQCIRSNGRCMVHWSDLSVVCACVCLLAGATQFSSIWALCYAMKFNTVEGMRGGTMTGMCSP